MKKLTVYDLCAEDHYLFAHLRKDGDVTVQIENDDSKEVYRQTSHIYAWDSLVSFARQVLKCDEKIQEERK